MSTNAIYDARITSPEYLEQQLFAPDLMAFIELLRGYRGDQGHTLETVLGTALPRVLERGLGELTINQIRGLLNNSESLMELQDRVYADGGAYWDPIMLGKEEVLSEETEFAIHAVDAATYDFPEEKSAKTSIPLVEPEPSNTVTLRETRVRPWRHQLLLIAGAACALLAGIISFDLLQRSSETDLAVVSSQNFLMGLEQLPPETFLTNAAGHFRSLALSPALNDREQLKARIGLFDHTCDLFSKSSMKQLDERERRELKQQCGVWLGELRAINFDAVDIRTGVDQYNELIGRIGKYIDDMSVASGDGENAHV